MMLTKLIYIASPYSYKSRFRFISYLVKAYRNYRITKIIGKLQDKYKYAFIGPITQSHQTAKYMKTGTSDFNSWAVRDLTYISRCDEVWVVKLLGWKESKGVLAEIEFANDVHGCPIYYLNPRTLRKSGG